MLFATVFGLLLVPVFYVAIRRALGEKLDAPGVAQSKQII
jgi:multidrug efflux pump